MSEQRPGPMGPVEPSADLREFASNIRQMYLALVEQGFTEQQAFNICGITIASAFGSSS